MGKASIALVACIFVLTRLSRVLLWSFLSHFTTVENGTALAFDSYSQI